LCISIGLKTASKSQQNASISAKNFKKFSGEGAQFPPQTPPPMVRGTPPFHTVPHPLVAFGYSPLVACGHSLGDSNLAPQSF